MNLPFMLGIRRDKRQDALMSLMGYRNYGSAVYVQKFRSA